MKRWKTLFGAVALSAACVPAWAVPTLSFTSPGSVPPGSFVGVDVVISDVSDLYAYNFSITFDPKVVDVGGVSQQGFLSSAGPTFGTTGEIDNSTGIISFAGYTLVGPQAGASGSGSLLHITFNALANGVSSLNFSDLVFLDSNLNDIAVTANPGSVTISTIDVPEPGSWMLVGIGAVAAAALRRRTGARCAACA
ncbi:PEP-CTERM sorting domain-containing protein [Massilia forsythiae]|uniref:PEP-CTERM sorting domain-containing protein n=1 Tax=Massilia forsythiae TaxID=2728020 RepID=A0A7Z2W268_9BURK|nr:cohesin domain-containing protein [Massilia forsythiae]QJE03438.1 PEP-CTERM sorting domain-containing protein [Massilia forsythiae]